MKQFLNYLKGASLNFTFKLDDFIELKILSNLSFLSG